MKRILTLILVAFAVQAAFAATVKVQYGDLYYNLDTSSKTASVTYDTSSQPSSSTKTYVNFSNKVLTIPEIVENDGEEYKVTSIGNYAFYRCSGLTSVTFSQGITSIGSYAFGYCSGLTFVTFPELLTSIDWSAFYYCSGLTSVSFPERLTSIGDNAFSYCSGLTTVTFPEGLMSIGSSAFRYCSGLTSVYFSEGITTIGSYAFQDCSNLREVNIPSLRAWYNINFGNNYSNPNYYAKNLLINGEELSGIVALPSDWTKVPAFQFIGCKAVTEFILPEGLTSISGYAFYYCSALTSVNFPEGITSIYTYAFSGCSSLSSVNLPEGITTIGSYAFSGCSSLSSVNLPEGITSIDNYAFSGCSNLTSIKFPKSITQIGMQSFQFCSNLSSVTFMESHTTIDRMAFYNCSNLTEVNSPSIEAWCNLKFINNDSNPNYYASNLQIDGKELSGIVALPSDLTEIPDYQFYGCDEVTEFILPKTIISIGNHAFAGCGSLSVISFPESLLNVKSSAFISCKNLMEVNCPSFEAWCKIRFANDTSNPNYYAKNLKIDGKELSDIVILPSDWAFVPTAQFAGCDAVTEFILHENIKSISNYAFYSCSNLKSIFFPQGITSIGEYAFKSCSGLSSVALPEYLTSIGYSAFEGCSGLTSVNLPEGLSSIASWAFSSCSKLLKVVSLNQTPPSNTSSSFENPAESTGILYVPEESLQVYQSTNYWNQFQNIQPIVVASGLELSAEKNPLAIGHSQQITVTLTPEDATVDQFKWSSSDEAVATVDGFGKVTALKAGTTTITAKTIDGSDIEATLELTVTDLNGSFEIENFEMLLEEDLSVPVNLNLNFNDCRYSALQFDLSLPEDIELKSVVLGDQLLDAAMELTYKVQDNGDVRIIVTPTENLDGVNCTDDILFLNLAAIENATPATSSILISNASLSTVDGADIFLENSSCTVTLRKLLLGDANDNGSVTVADVVTIANFIAKKEVVAWSFVNADVNRDKQITPADITGTVNIISGEEITPAAIVGRRATQAENDRLVIDNFSPVEGESFRIGVRLNNTRQYSALHSSVLIPEGMTVEGVSKGSQAPSHSLIHNVTDEGRVEVVIFSTSNKPFLATDGSLFELEVRAAADCGDIRMENILASDASATDYELMYEGGRNSGISTGVDCTYDLNPKVMADAQGITVYYAEGMNVSIYAVTGEIVANRVAMASPERFRVAKGIYIVTIEGKNFKIKI